MPITATAQGKKFTFPDGTSPEDMGVAIDEFFRSQQPQPASPLEDPAVQQRAQELVKLGIPESEAMRVAIEGQPQDLGKQLLGAGEAALTLGRGIVAEPLAGLAGLVSTPFVGGERGAEIVGEAREAITGQPRTKEAQEILGSIGSALEPVGDAFTAAEDFLGDTALELTGSPAVATIAKTLPTAAMEALGGFAAIKRGAKVGKQAGKVQKIKPKQVDRALVESAPDIDALNDAQSAIFREIDDLDVAIKPKEYRKMLVKAIRVAKNERVDAGGITKSASTFNTLVKELDRTKPFSKVRLKDADTIRKRVQDAARSIDPTDSRVGMLMLDEVDNFLDKVQPSSFIGSDAAKAGEIGKRYNVARKLYGRAKRAELMQEALDKAKGAASGFENGMRKELRKIVDNKKRSRYFSKEEIQGMRDVIEGTSAQNILKLVGRFGFSEGQATNVLGGTAGLYVGGPALATVGQFARRIAPKITGRQFDVADAIIKAGPNARKITEAYMRMTPKSKRSAMELSQLLIDRGADIDEMVKSSNQFARRAAEIAKGRLAFLGSAATAGAVTGATTQED